MTRGELVEVTLVEGDGRRLSRHARRRARSRRRPLGAVLVVLLAVLVLSGGRAEALLAARLRDAVGLSTGLGAPPAVAWRARVDDVLGTVGGAVLVSERRVAQVAALDLADGTVRWRTGLPVDPGWCWLAVAEPVPVLLCARAGSGTLVWPLDPATGRVRESLVWPGSVSLVTPLDEDLVLAGNDAQGHAAARRWSPVTGVTRWSYRSSARSAVPPTWDAGDGWILLRGQDLVLSTGSGEPVPGTGVGSGRSVALGGSTAVQSWTTDGRPMVVVVGGDDARHTQVAGALAPIEHGDGTARGVALVASGTTLTRLGPDGSARWRVTGRPGAPAQPVLACDGVLVVSEGDEVVAVRARDGAELWRVATGLTQSASAVTDGRLVAVAQRDAGGTALVAHEPTNGRTVWRLALPDSPTARMTLAPDGTIVVPTVVDLVVLRAAVKAARP
ncbi:PQQ-binding-like beta-propeller repeat protein [Isoptericola sp. b441]|uniref:PQQ-binding-like beta-propeller repeat protein n=1 Tax=Actinotalea lenta TaxID=3064654 RepID=A0ABT9D6S8_9CELL|nr:PQQ-binding-like beta-propeller repeat protein [Isoptericola sp. b441]MDO8106548.1 PQQ-binding-like beta-propeller repeat protein [Isoptericola sp. b441]